ncbi:Protein eva-1 like C [Pseudolycoriella hygida]|uniref:Protein eva-1 like C n=1 Tax=Pseudolycoriella hygida TaxID=35572 RepID=A0A9Q0MMR0_9DIPT|nr:Protein eva-1 like C [Pseudolycoriella hygida]
MGEGGQEENKETEYVHIAIRWKCQQTLYFKEKTSPLVKCFVSNGTTAVSICPPSTDDTILEAIHTGAEIEVKPPENCLPNALQYLLIQNVVEACQKKSHCKFLASPKTHGGDPCPGKRKFVEVAYKCRPFEFRSKIACENEVIQLSCNPYSRVAIYSASFGRTEYESIQCSQPQKVMEEIPRKVLKDRFDYSNEPDEPHQVDMDQNQDELYDEDQFYRESEAIPPAPKLHRELSNPSSGSNLTEPALNEPSSSANPPLRSRDSNLLEDKVVCFPVYESER